MSRTVASRVILGIMVLLLVVTIIFSPQEREPEFVLLANDTQPTLNPTADEFDPIPSSVIREEQVSVKRNGTLVSSEPTAANTGQNPSNIDADLQSQCGNQGPIVCGSDGKYYPNDCFVQAKNLRVVEHNYCRTGGSTGGGTGSGNVGYGGGYGGTQVTSAGLPQTFPSSGSFDALRASFNDGLPPVEVFDDGQHVFSVAVTLYNAGEAAVGWGTDNPFGYVELLGFSPVELQALETYIPFDEADLTLLGVRKDPVYGLLPGESATFVFEDFSYITDLAGDSEFTIRADLCYDYEGLATSKLCFKENILENALDDSICTLAGGKEVDNTIGPVHVTSLTQNPLGPNRIHTTFAIEHVGNGLIYSRNSTDGCVNSVTNADRDVVYVTVWIDGLDPDLIRCPLLEEGWHGSVKMNHGFPLVMSCTVELPLLAGGRAFEEIMNVHLAYTHFFAIETPVLVRDVSNR